MSETVDFSLSINKHKMRAESEREAVENGSKKLRRESMKTTKWPKMLQW